MSGMTPDKRQIVRDLYKTLGTIRGVSSETGVPATTVSRMVADLKTPVTTPNRALSDDDVITMRKLAKEDKEFTLSKYAKIHGVDIETIGKAVRGHTYKNVNAIEPPVIQRYDNVKDRREARRLYREGKTYNQIKDILKVSKSSISLWCRDLVVPKVPVKKSREEILNKKAEQARERAAKKAAGKEKYVPKRSLTVDQVVSVRRQVRENQCLDVKTYADRYGVGVSTMTLAIRGGTFKEANALEPPVTEKFKRKGRTYIKKEKPPRVFEPDPRIVEAAQLRRSDPKKWTYGAIAKWLKETTGINYGAGPISKMLLKYDPSLKDLEAVSPYEQVRKEMKRYVILTPEQIKQKVEAGRARRLIKKQEEEALAEAIRQADLYEERHDAWVKAGKPDDWIWE